MKKQNPTHHSTMTRTACCAYYQVTQSSKLNKNSPNKKWVKGRRSADKHFKITLIQVNLNLSSFPKVWQSVFVKSPFLPRMKLYCANCAFLIFLFNVQPGSRSMSTMNLASWNCCRTYLNSENSSDLKENYILTLNNFI